MSAETEAIARGITVTLLGWILIALVVIIARLDELVNHMKSPRKSAATANPQASAKDREGER